MSANHPLDEQAIRTIVEDVMRGLGRAAPVAASASEPRSTAAPSAPRSRGPRYGVFDDVKEACAAAQVAFEQLRNKGVAGRAKVVEIVKDLCTRNAKVWGKFEFDETSTVFQPICGKISLFIAETSPGQISRPLVAPFSVPMLKRICIPTQIPKIGRLFLILLFKILGPSTARKPAMHDANAPTPGTTRPNASSQILGSLVTTTGRPVVANARSADRIFPDP